MQEAPRQKKEELISQPARVTHKQCFYIYPGIATAFTPTLNPKVLIKIRRRDNLAA